MVGLGIGTSIKLEGFKNLSDVKWYAAEVDAKTVALFEKLTNNDLERQFKWIRPDGSESVACVGDMLYHVPLEILHHYVELF